MPKEKQDKSPPIFGILFELLVNIKFAHVMTLSFAKHQSTDKLYEKMNKSIDDFMEVFVSKYGRPKDTVYQTVSYKHMSDSEFITYLKHISNFFSNDVFKYIKKEDTDLISIIDEIKVYIHKSLYQLDMR
jgi:DNA-binding ferritin-like protein